MFVAVHKEAFSRRANVRRARRAEQNSKLFHIVDLWAYRMRNFAGRSILEEQTMHPVDAEAWTQCR